MRKRILVYLLVLTFISNILYVDVYAKDMDVDFTVESEIIVGNNATAGEGIQIKYTVTPMPIDLPQAKKDIVLIIDTSSSMKEANKMNDMKRSVKAFIEELAKSPNASIDVGIVTYDIYANSLQSNGEFFLSTKDEKSKLINLIDNIDCKYDYNGRNLSRGTNIGDGIRLAYDKLRGKGSADEKYVVLMTDGQPSAASFDYHPPKYEEGEVDVPIDKQGPYRKNSWTTYYIYWVDGIKYIDFYKSGRYSVTYKYPYGDWQYRITDKIDTKKVTKQVEVSPKTYEFLMDSSYEFDRTHDYKWHLANPEGENDGKSIVYWTAYYDIFRNQYMNVEDFVYNFSRDNSTDDTTIADVYTAKWVENLKDNTDMNIRPYYVAFGSDRDWSLEAILDETYLNEEDNKKFYKATDGDRLKKVYKDIAKDIDKSKLVEVSIDIEVPEGLKLAVDGSSGLVNIPIENKHIEYKLNSAANKYEAEPFHFTVDFLGDRDGDYSIKTTVAFKHGGKVVKKSNLINVNVSGGSEDYPESNEDENVKISASTKDFYFVNNDIDVEYTVTKKKEGGDGSGTNEVVDLVVVLHKNGFQWNYYLPKKYKDSPEGDKEQELWGINEYGNTTKNAADIKFALDIVNRFKDNKNVRVGLVSYANLAEYHYYDNGDFFSDLTTEAARNRFMENVKADPKCHNGKNSIGNIQSYQNPGDGLRLAYHKLKQNNGHKKHLLYIGDGFASAETYTFNWAKDKDVFYFGDKYDSALVPDDVSYNSLNKWKFNDYFWFKIKGSDYKDQESLYLNYMIGKLKSYGVSAHYLLPFPDHGDEGSLDDYTHTLADPFDQDNGSRANRLTPIGSQVCRNYGFTKGDVFDIVEYRKHPELIYRNDDPEALFENFKLIADDINDNGGGGPISDVKIELALPEGMEIIAASSEGNPLTVLGNTVEVLSVDKIKNVKISTETARPDMYKVNARLKYKTGEKNKSLPFSLALNVRPLNTPTILISQVHREGKKEGDNKFKIEDNGSQAVVFKDKKTKIDIKNSDASNADFTSEFAGDFSIRLKVNPFEFTDKDDIFETDNFKIGMKKFVNKDGKEGGEVVVSINGVNDYRFASDKCMLEKDRLNEIFVTYDSKGDLYVYINGCRFKRAKINKDGVLLEPPINAGAHLKLGGFKGFITEFAISDYSFKYDDGIVDFVKKANDSSDPEVVKWTANDLLYASDSDELVVFENKDFHHSLEYSDMALPDDISGFTDFKVYNKDGLANFEGEELPSPLGGAGKVEIGAWQHVIVDNGGGEESFYSNPVKRLINIIIQYLDHDIL